MIMRTISLLLCYTLFIYVLIGCKDDKTIVKPEPPNPPPTPKEEINIVSQFAYDGLSMYYKWAEDMKSKKPTISDKDPQKYFNSLLHTADKKYSWSWLTNDVEKLLKGFAGEYLSFGYNLTFMYANEQKKEFYAIIRYVFPNTPASEKGLQRLDLITQINGQPITNKNYNELLYNSKTIKLSISKLTKEGIKKDKDINITPKEVNTNPVLVDSIYKIGDKKIGYLFYTGFISNYNDKLYEAFSKFKKDNVTDLILDLRYNRGGAISAASYLASMIAPETNVKSKEILTTLTYNDYLNKLVDEKGWSRSNFLGTYNKEKEKNPLSANINLNKVYVIATGGSYSASELTPFCLRPYMEVVHIGGKTGGKYTASWTVTPYRPFNDENGKRTVNSSYDEEKLSAKEKETLENWAMQPIVAIYRDKNGNDFIETNGLIPNYELREGFGYIDYWKELGSVEDVFLGQALFLITGNEKYKPVKPTQTRSTMQPRLHHIIPEDFLIFNESQTESVVIDNIRLTPENMQEIMMMKEQEEF